MSLLKPSCDEIRVQTFYNHQVGKTKTEDISWPYKSPSVQSMAKHGFYFTPTKTKRDQVTCFCCMKKDHGWKNVKDITDHHLKLNPKCSYALFHKARSERDFFTESSVDLSSQKNTSKSSKGLKHRKQNNSHNLLLNYDWSSNSVFANPNSKQAIKIRKDFFKFWPKEKPSKEDLIEAGFYSLPASPNDDYCVCLYCRLSLEDWGEDDHPLTEHKKFSPDCYFFNSSTKQNSDSQPSNASSKNSSKTQRPSRKRNSSEDVSDSEDSSANTNGALISSSASNLNKRSKRAPQNTSLKKNLLDDNLDESLQFLKNLPDSNKENRSSGDFDTLTSFDKSLRKFKTLQKYNSTAVNLSKTKAMKITKKKQGLLFSSDDEMDKPKKQKRKKAPKQAKTSSTKNANNNDNNNDENASDKTITLEKASQKEKQNIGDAKADSQDDKRNSTITQESTNKTLNKEIHNSEVVSESTRHFDKSKPQDESNNGNVHGDALNRSAHDEGFNDNAHGNNPNDFDEVPINDDVEKSNSTLKAKKSTNEKALETPKANPQNKDAIIGYSQGQGDIVDEPSVSFQSATLIQQGSDPAPSRDDHHDNPIFKKPASNVFKSNKAIHEVAEENELDLSSLIEDSEILSPEKKDPSLYSSSTPLSQFKLLRNQKLDSGIPVLKKPDNDFQNKLIESVLQTDINDIPEEETPSRPRTGRMVSPSPPPESTPRMMESTRIDFRNYSLNPANLDDSDYDVSISVYEKKDGNNFERLTTPAKSNGQMMSTPIFNPDAEGTSDQIESINDFTPLTPAPLNTNNEIQLRTINSIPHWTPKPKTEISSKYEDLQKANEFLKDILCLDYQLNQDIDGILAAFINQVPQKELNMTIGEWIQYQTEQCKKLLKIKCDEMIKEFEDEGERAIEFVQNMQ